jgi:hypothetical protein
MRVVPEVSSVGQTVALSSTQNTSAINQQHLETTVLAADGETVAIGGMITKTDNKNENKIPWFGDLPYVGALFRYRSSDRTKVELLVILTPHIVRSRVEADTVLAQESKRMDWVISDVMNVHGTTGLEPIFPKPAPGAAGLAPEHLPGCPVLTPMAPSAPGKDEVIPPPRALPPASSQSAAPSARSQLSANLPAESVSFSSAPSVVSAAQVQMPAELPPTPVPAPAADWPADKIR